jgi:hypothetical protein
MITAADNVDEAIESGVWIVHARGAELVTREDALCRFGALFATRAARHAGPWNAILPGVRGNETIEFEPLRRGN